MILEQHEYFQFVDYSPIPPMAKLEKQFFGTPRYHDPREKRVSEIYDGRPFERDRSCLTIDTTPGERVFRLFLCPHIFYHGHKNMIEWCKRQRSMAAPKAYRPAIEIEAYHFARAHPELLKQFWFVALGSFARSKDVREKDKRYIPVFGSYLNGRVPVMGGIEFDLELPMYYQYLFVAL